MRKFLTALSVAIVVSALAAPAATAQDGPSTRVTAVTKFQVPFGPERNDVFQFMRDYFWPGYQLNPHVRNFRVLTHNWGANASDVLLMAEYDTVADIEADCGQPCDDYFEANGPPEQGEAGYDVYQRQLQAWNKAYATHHDEIYTSNMNRAVIEGEMQGRVGPPPAAD